MPSSANRWWNPVNASREPPPSPYAPIVSASEPQMARVVIPSVASEIECPAECQQSNQRAMSFTFESHHCRVVHLWIMRKEVSYPGHDAHLGDCKALGMRRPVKACLELVLASQITPDYRQPYWAWREEAERGQRDTHSGYYPT